MPSVPANPSDVEFEGLYNVPRDPSEDPDIEHLLTTKRVAPLRFPEVNEIASRLLPIVCAKARSHDYTPDEIQRYYDMCINKGLSDRTLNLSFMDPHDCTQELLDAMRAFLATHYPLWRIRIGGSARETNILVYPHTIRYGPLPPDQSGPEALEHILNREGVLRNRSPLIEIHRRIVRQAVARAIEAGLLDRPVILARFDNYEGDGTYQTLWTLCGPGIVDLDLLAPPPAMAESRLAAKPNGDFGYHVSDDSPYWVRQWLFPREQTLTRLRFQAYDADRVPFPIEVMV